MFRLFHSIFSTQRASAEGYPESLVEAAIERAVDGTDPRVRAVGGYRKRLRGPVLCAVDHVVRLVDSIPAAVTVDARGYREDACLRSMFASSERMLELLGRDRALTEALDAGASRITPLIALMVMRMSEKHTLGIEIEDDVMKRDVQQTVVSFDAHRLVDPHAQEDETRRALKRRAFDHILAQVLDDMGGPRNSRGSPTAQRELLKRKRAALKKAGWSFDAGKSQAPADQATLEKELLDIDASLAALGPDEPTLETHLELLANALMNPGSKLWLEPRRLILDHRNVVRAVPDSVARELEFGLLHDGRGDRMAMVLVSVDPGLVPRSDFFGAASRYIN
jgi:hypothetical protein